MVMADKMTKNYKVSGSGVLWIDGDAISISVEDKGDFNLATVLADLDEKPVKFSFSYDEDYEEPVVKVNKETGEIIK
jgi:lipoate-protein ligase A